MTRRGITAFVLFAFSLASPIGASAQVAPLTVGAVRAALVDAIARLDSALDNAAQNTKAVGTSLEANARGVVSDIDSRLGDKLAYTFDRLDESERRLMEDAQALVGRIEAATDALLVRAGDEARAVLGEADILAYDTLYSLPCRSQEPRIVYVKPGRLFAETAPRELIVRGNYLALGPEPAVTVGGRAAEVIARNQNEMRLRVPDALFAGLQSPRSVAVRFRPTVRTRSLFLGLICRSSSHLAETPLSAASVLVPTTRLKVVATLTPLVKTLERKEIPYDLDVGDEDCDADYSVDRNWCVEDGWRLASWSGPGIHSKNCGSRVNSTARAGDKCILVSAKLEGCGYETIVFVKNCKGRGWLHYSGSLVAERDVDTPGPVASVSTEVPAAKQSTFILRYPEDLPAQTVSGWKYQATLSVMRGSGAAPVKVVQLSDVLRTADGVASDARDGQLVIRAESLVKALSSPGG